MRSVITTIPKPAQIAQRLYSSESGVALQAVYKLRGPIHSIDVQEFRENGFIPERPILITSQSDTQTSSAYAQTTLEYSIPAAVKWFEAINAESGCPSQGSTVSQHYLSPFGTTILPYEFIVESNKSHTNVVDDGTGSQGSGGGSQHLSKLLDELTKGSPEGAFHKFNAPLSLFLQACRFRSAPRLYIAQAQIADLPKELQDDLPTPKLVKEAGKGDVYDSNIWMGIAPTYTPLHKDPNPNLFIQLASSKRVKIFRPIVGSAIYREVQQRIGQSNPSSFRGEEMMEDPERDALDESVWGQCAQAEGYEVVVSAGDGLFIPKGWWHSIKSIGTGVTASVNWWFR
jgi:hypothetical protein